MLQEINQLGQHRQANKASIRKKIADEHHDAIRSHISSFNRVESHYCRSKSVRQYLDSGLSLGRMYDMFCEERLKKNPDHVEPVKKH